MSTCFWCTRVLEKNTKTRDHLIPQWACRLFYIQLGHANARRNIVSSCTSCNSAKGGMPPETYHRVRRNSGERKLASLNWHYIQEQACVAWSSEAGAVDPDLRAYIIAEMLKPVPGHVYVPTPLEEEIERTISTTTFTEYDVNLLNAHTPKGAKGEPFSKNKPLKRLAYTCGAVAQATVLDHEKLNDNLQGELR